MLEKDIQAKILRYLRTRPDSYSWKQHAGQYARAGLPDIMHVERGQLYIFEVKQPGNTATPLQAITIERLQTAGAIGGVVYGLGDVFAYFPDEAEKLKPFPIPKNKKGGSKDEN